MPELEVHHINVSQGDCTLLINRDLDKVGQNIDNAILGDSSLPVKPTKKEDYLPYAVKHKVELAGTIRKAVLIDAGDDAYGGDVASYLGTQGITKSNSKTILYTICTHYHADHVGGFRDVFYEDYDYNKKKLAVQKVKYAPKTAYDCGDLNKSWDNSVTRASYISMVDNLAGTTDRQSMKVNYQYSLLGEDSNKTKIVLRCIGSNGSIATKLVTNKQVIKPKKSSDQNARSIVLIVEYGDFRYFLGGDAGGTGLESGGNFGKNKDTRKKRAFSSHPDIETSITAVLPKYIKKDANRSNTADGHICVHCADHHGSTSSNDVFLIEQMQPKVVICSSGVRRSFHWHPTQEFFQRVDPSVNYSPNWQQPGNISTDNPTVDNTVAAYYVTEMAKNGTYRKTPFTRTFPEGKILGDIVVRPISAVVPANKTGTNTIEIQVYGTGLGTDSSVTNIPLRPFTTGTIGSVYPVGPFTHTCDKH